MRKASPKNLRSIFKFLRKHYLDSRLFCIKLNKNKIFYYKNTVFYYKNTIFYNKTTTFYNIDLKEGNKISL